MRVTDIPEIAQLSTPEKILLVEDLWDSIASDESGVPVSQSHKEAIGPRAAELSGGSGQSFIARGTAGKNREQAMTYVLRFLPIIEEDALAGYTWYEEKARGLGGDLPCACFYAGAREIPRNPLLYPKVYREFRRRLLRRFPYAIYFRIEDETVIVFGLFHCARDPRTIRAQPARAEDPPESP